MDALRSCDVVVKSPGISRYRPEVAQLGEAGVNVCGGLGLFMAEADPTRVVCITCGKSGHLALKSIEGDGGAVKAETCDDCHTYAKLLYAAKDTQVDAFADDLASLALEVLVAEAGWSRHAPNPWLLVG